MLGKVVRQFLWSLGDVGKLEGIAEPSFCKYLLGLKRDLKMQGLNIDNHIKEVKEVKLKQILSYEY